jgi:hypothetical protein
MDRKPNAMIEPQEKQPSSRSNGFFDNVDPSETWAAPALRNAKASFVLY